MAFLSRLRKPKAPAQPAPPMSPRGSSGRVHTDGFIAPDEVNLALVGQLGLEKFDEMFRTDADCRRALMMIVVALAAGTWTVEPFEPENEDEDPTDEDLKVAAFTEWALFKHMAPDFISHIWEMLRVCLRSGFAPFEEIWHVSEWDGRPVLTPRTLDLRLPRTIQRWMQDGPDLVAIEQLQAFGGLVTLKARDILYYRLGAEGDNWEGESLLRPAYKHWKIKSAIELVQAIGIERTAIGVPTGYPPMSASATDLEAFEDFLSTIRANEATYFLAPGPRADHASTQNGTEGWFWEFVTPASQVGSSADTEAALNYHTGKIDAVVLAEFMRLGQQGEGARATADVQQNPFLALAEGLVHLLVEAPVNGGLIPRLVGLNFDTDRFPKVSCSLIDSTSLAELGTYVSVLVDKGAIRVEPTLEAHLRDLADLPEADEAAIAEREAADQEREDAMLKQTADLKAAAAPPGGGMQGTGGARPSAKVTPKAGAKTPPKPAAKKKLDAGDEPMTLGRSDRPLRDWERPMSLDRIEATIDEAQARMEQAAGAAARALAVSMSHGIKRANSSELEAAVLDVLCSLFATGRATVIEELQRQRFVAHGWMLEVNGLDDMPPDERHTLVDRAKAIADTVRASVTAAVAGSALQRGADEATVQGAAEQAAVGALRSQAQIHASSALNAGRTVEADVHAEEIAGARYTSILDGRRCSGCARADDDVLRSLDDPVRLAHVPPNPDCEGGGRCRCMEAFVLREEESTQ
jgi:hypothetical protein